MKRYFLDTNIILRFLLQDNEKSYAKAKNYLDQAKTGIVELITIPEIFFEIDYVLRGVYKVSKPEVCDIILKLLATPYLNIIDRSILVAAINKYKRVNIDFFDFYLYFKAEDQKATVLSFDRDLGKI